MHRFVLPLCLLLAAFDLRVDTVLAEACVQVRAMPTGAPRWCVQAPPLATWVAPAVGATVHVLALQAQTKPDRSL